MLKEMKNECQMALEAITRIVLSTGEGNLLELAVVAASKRASLGEISYACEKIAGRYKAVIQTLSGVYSSEYKSDDDLYRKPVQWLPNLRRKRAVSPGL